MSSTMSRHRVKTGFPLGCQGTTVSLHIRRKSTVCESVRPPALVKLPETAHAGPLCKCEPLEGGEISRMAGHGEGAISGGGGPGGGANGGD